MLKKASPDVLDDHSIVREKVVLSLVPFGRGELRGRVKRKEYPQPVRVRTAGGKVILGWVLAEVRAYNASLIRQRDQEIAAAKAAELTE
jgi:predicted DNA-binding transcriptional regulator AlpA